MENANNIPANNPVKVATHQKICTETFARPCNTRNEGDLFEACGINQANLSAWFDKIEPLEDHEKQALFYLTSVAGYKLDDALAKVEYVQISECRLGEAAEELFNECYAHSIPENLRNYIDYKAFATDCEQSGDMSEFEYTGKTYTCVNSNGT